MLSNERYVKDSLELHLFFLRIMKEHMMFIAGSLTPRDMNFGIIAEGLKNKLEEVLRAAIKVSNGVISEGAKSSGEIVTKYTLSAEKMTEFYTGSHINTDITNMEIRLVQEPSHKTAITHEILKDVQSINHCVIPLLEEVIKFKKIIKENVLNCKMFTMNYPLLLDHILREAEFYLKSLQRIQRKEEINIAKEALIEENFWNTIMEEHSEFIRGLLDPTEEKLIEIADNFAKTFDKLGKEGMKIHDNVKALEALTRESLDKTKKIREFKKQGTEGILGCKIKSIIIPLLSDHVLREASHYLRLLNKFSKVHGV